MEIAGNLIRVTIEEKTFVQKEVGQKYLSLKLCIMDKVPYGKKDVVRFANLSSIRNIDKLSLEIQNKVFNQSVDYWSKHNKGAIFRVINTKLNSMTTKTETGKNDTININANFNNMDCVCLCKSRENNASFVLEKRTDLMNKYGVEIKDETIEEQIIDIELT